MSNRRPPSASIERSPRHGSGMKQWSWACGTERGGIRPARRKGGAGLAADEQGPAPPRPPQRRGRAPRGERVRSDELPCSYSACQAPAASAGRPAPARACSAPASCASPRAVTTRLPPPRRSHCNPCAHSGHGRRPRATAYAKVVRSLWRAGRGGPGVGGGWRGLEGVEGGLEGVGRGFWVGGRRGSWGGNAVKAGWGQGMGSPHQQQQQHKCEGRAPIH